MHTDRGTFWIITGLAVGFALGLLTCLQIPTGG